MKHQWDALSQQLKEATLELNKLKKLVEEFDSTQGALKLHEAVVGVKEEEEDEGEDEDKGFVGVGGDAGAEGADAVIAQEENQLTPLVVVPDPTVASKTHEEGRAEIPIGPTKVIAEDPTRVVASTPHLVISDEIFD